MRRIGLIISALVLIALPITVFFLLQKTGYINRAAAPSNGGQIASITLDPQVINAEVGEEFEVAIKINTRGIPTSIVQTRLLYAYESDTAPFEVVDSQGTKADLVQVKPGNISELNYVTNDTSDNITPGTNQHQVIIRLDGVTPDSTKPFIANDDTIFGSIKFLALNPTEKTPLYFDPQNTKITTDSGEDILLIPNDATITISGQSTTNSPKISSVYPTRGSTGNTVIITGENFGEDQKEATIAFGEIQTAKSDIKGWSNSNITVLVPADASTGKIQVNTANGSAISTELFEIVAPESGDLGPKIESFHPKNISTEAPVTIIGTNFGTSQETSTVTIGETPIATFYTWSNVLIEAEVPPSAKTDKITITTILGTTTTSECLAINGTVSPNAECLVQDFNTTSVSTVNITEDSATILWSTDKEASSQVEYGIASAYSNQTPVKDLDTPVTEHTVTLEGLTNCTTYNFQTLSKVDNEQSLSGNFMFTTTGCIGDSKALTETSSEINASYGGAVSLTEGGESIKIEAPTDYHETDTIMQIKKLEEQAVIDSTSTPTNKTAVGSNFYELDALVDENTTITSFQKPIAITVSYNPLDLNPSLAEESLKIHRWNGDYWEELSNCQVDTTAHQVTCTTTKFSTYGVFAEAASQTAAETEVEAAALTTTPVSPTTVPENTITQTPALKTPVVTVPIVQKEATEASGGVIISLPATGITAYSKLLTYLGVALVMMGIIFPSLNYFLTRHNNTEKNKR